MKKDIGSTLPRTGAGQSRAIARRPRSLEPHRQRGKPDKHDRCSLTAFRRRIKKVFDATEPRVGFIDNGLGKSAISYWLAAHPEHGVGEVARYAGNSEASCRKHYLRILTKAQGEAWFNSAIAF